MNDSPTTVTSAERIWKASFFALVVAVIILLTVVLPTFYGIGPGQTVEPAVSQAGDEQAAPDAPESNTTDELANIMSGGVIEAEPGLHKPYTEPFKTEVVLIPLDEFAEVEYKAHMKEGDTILYSWKSAQLMYVDLHGEPFTYPEDEVVRYEELDGVTSGDGRVTASFPGLHGWFWLNTSETADVIELTVTGYYDKLEEVHRSSP
jgi:hypothetical protein